ncbi:MAG: GerMN domain-containing protein [Candidatus Colwellbacteria bacterium]|nr:GerMN domain-containing protein [Candidatus Colwellbacteria bacterium]
MNKHIPILFGAIVILTVTLLSIRFFSGSEDAWICQDGEWVQHGYPSTSMPEEACDSDSEDGVDGQESMAVQIFLSDSRFAGEPYFDCARTVAVERLVPKTLGVARVALETLLQGATQGEIDRGLFSSINSGVEIQKLTVGDGVAEVDFNEQLESQVGGSCRVTAIRAQIIDTLKQFPTVDSVAISINGRTEDILQP